MKFAEDLTPQAQHTTGTYHNLLLAPLIQEFVLSTQQKRDSIQLNVG